MNQPPRSAVREAFSRLVLGAPPQEFTAYWNDLYFHGVSPPPVLGSDDAVLLYVERTPGAIGYTKVAAARTAGSRVRVVLVLPMT